MTIRQRFLQFVYPAYVRLSRLSPVKSLVLSHEPIHSPASFYDLHAIANDGSTFSFAQLRNKWVLIVNTASGCGFTEQFDQLQVLYKQFAGNLIVMAFPTNDFKEERASDEAIALFCREHFRVSFPLMQKTSVKKGKGQHPVFAWLTDPSQNAWNSQAPAWNFCKYLVDDHGRLVNYFGTAIEPMGGEMAIAMQSVH